MNTERIIVELADLYRHEMTAPILASYLQALSEYSPAEVRESSREWQKRSHWMPRPADLVGLIRSARGRAYVAEQNRKIIEQARGQKLTGGFRVPEGMRILDYCDVLREKGLSPDEIAEAICG